jgi:acetyltransferase-like isoleucine patch superfamily enzyme
MSLEPLTYSAGSPVSRSDEGLTELVGRFGEGRMTSSAEPHAELPPNPYNSHAWIVGDPHHRGGHLDRGVHRHRRLGRSVIGRGCDVSSGVQIYTHSTVRRCVSGRSYDQVDRKPVVIGDRVFLGANSVVMMGVTIGDGAVIGAGAVVNRDVPPRTVVAGVPARRVGTVTLDGARVDIVRNDSPLDSDEEGR